MSKILEEMLGEDGKFNTSTLLLKLTEIEKRLDILEERNETGGVYVDGSPDIVKNYYKELLEKEKKVNGGGA